MSNKRGNLHSEKLKILVGIVRSKIVSVRCGCVKLGGSCRDGIEPIGFFVASFVCSAFSKVGLGCIAYFFFDPEDFSSL